MSKLTQTLKDQKMSKLAELLAPARITEGEKNTLKTVFSDDVQAYKILRDVMFGFTIEEGEKNAVSNFKIIKPLLRKIFIPETKKDIAIGQNFDLWQTQDIKVASDENFETIYRAKEILLEMLEAGLKRLDDPDSNSVDISIKKDLPSLIARNSYISYVDSQIRFIIQFVNMDSLSPEERLRMMSMNSSK